MSADDLRARCLTCLGTVAVHRRGAVWRMAAHKRTVAARWAAYEVACPVRGVDALPAIRAWLDHEANDQVWREASANTKRAEAVAAIAAADAALDKVRATRETLVALRALVDAALPSPTEAAPAAAGRGR